MDHRPGEESPRTVIVPVATGKLELVLSWVA